MNIWQVIQFSAAASLVAAVILGIKLLFHDKLDARWHYLIWLVLLVRMLVPVQVDFIRTPVSLFETVPVLEWLRVCELAAHKAGMDGVMDMLFRIYLAGAAVFLFYDLICYLSLRLGIALAKEDRGQQGGKRRGTLWKVSETVCRKVESIAQKYGLKACRRICVQAAPTPYVCGLWRTALVLTEEMAYRLEMQGEEPACGTETREEGSAERKAPLDPDEAVIVHELLHRKYKDVLVNFLLHLVRALNWFNPFIWYVTGVVQNDSEALCDQRVLECLDAGKENERGYEKEYGMLLLHMAEKKERNPAKAGTSNMANAFRNMKTRIRRIADFKRVPSGIGLVTLCITLMLSASGIGYCQGEETLDTRVIKSERGMKLALLRAELYEAENPAQALYLYLSAMRYANPLYLMAVMPERMRQEYEGWVLENYRWSGDDTTFNDWIGQWKESGYFPQEPYALTGFTVYNLRMDDADAAQTSVLVCYGQDETLLWSMEFMHEDGWKVRRKEETRVDRTVFEEPALFQLTGQGERFRVETACWNEGSFDDLNMGYTFTRTAAPSGFVFGNGYDGASGQEMRPLKELSIEYKMSADYLSYIGDEDLAGHLVGVVMLEEGENKEDYESCFQAAKGGGGDGGSGSFPGGSYYYADGSGLADGGRIMLAGGGIGFIRWENTEKPVRHVWIYVDRELVEEFDVTAP